MLISYLTNRWNRSFLWMESPISDRQGSFVAVYISHEKWVFECMSGATGRIMMSLTGNSLKYTQAGFMKIDLALRETVSSHRNSAG